MTKTDYALRTLLAVILIGLGMLVSVLRGSAGADDRSGLGMSLWVVRRADLMVQLALMFVSALGIRALLPGEGEEVGDASVD